MRCVASEGARRRSRREHGFQLPLHPLQVSGWLALTVLSAASYLLLVPGLPHHFQVNKPVVATDTDPWVLCLWSSHPVTWD